MRQFFKKSLTGLKWMFMIVTLVGVFTPFFDANHAIVHAYSDGQIIERVDGFPIVNEVASGPNIQDSFHIVSEPTTQVKRQYPNIQVLVDESMPNRAYAMWHKKPIRLDKPFKAHFWVYGKGTGAGMTFTVQGQGIDAIGQPGQSLGAYGKFKAPYDGYIDHSFSVEFDNKYDSQSDGTTGDNSTMAGHMALTYPTEPALGNPNATGNRITKGKLTHYPSKAGGGMTIPMALKADLWHEVSFQYVPDRTDSNVARIIFDSGTSGAFKVNLRDVKGADKYWWGLTGATDQKDKMLGAIALAEPIQEPTMTKQVRNVTRDNQDGGGKHWQSKVPASYGEELEYKFKIDNPADFGLGETWQDVVINDDLPDGIVTKDGQSKVALAVGDVVSGGSKEIVFKAKLETKEVGLTLDNTGTASGKNAIQAPNYIRSTVAKVVTEKGPEIINQPVDLSIQTMIFNRNGDGNPESAPDFTKAYDVKAGDHLAYISAISNKVPNSGLTDGKIHFMLPQNAQLDGIKIDGQDYQWESVQIGDEYEITIQHFSIGADQVRNMQVDVTVNQFDEEFQHSSRVTVSGTNKDQSKYSKTGNSVTAFFVKDEVDEGDIEIQPKDIDFGAIPTCSDNRVIDRLDTTNSPNAVCEVKDTRVNKTQVKLQVTQNDIFKSVENESFTLKESCLRYYEQGTFKQMVVNEPIVIAEKSENEPLTSIIWPKKQGIRFFSKGHNYAVGHYMAKLTWTVVAGY